ncbi:hypothetical protein LCGC14_0701980 [marine sediment metagenome]|uniref:Uncharacterized protein n=1 Tax=marine sediment metagenome TaxID=412755 RepID=A0A0F9T3C1_9ZZZZ
MPPKIVYVIFHTPPFGVVEMKCVTADKKERDELVKAYEFVPKSGPTWYETYKLG